jgi:hypothetical protein
MDDVEWEERMGIYLNSEAGRLSRERFAERHRPIEVL